MKTLLCCLGLLTAMCLPGLSAAETVRTRGQYQAGVSDYLQAHVAKVSLSGNRVVLHGDGEVFALKGDKQNITGFSELIVLHQAGDSFVANFGAREGVNTILTLIKADASRIELRYRVMGARSGALRMDEGTIILPAAKTDGSASGSPGGPG